MAKLDEVLKRVPEFIKKLEKAKSEDAIAKACQEMKDAVDEIFNRFEGRRDPRSMAQIREAVNEKFHPKPIDDETKAKFPYYFASNKVGSVKRLEHLALKHLKDERNSKTDKPSAETTNEAIEVKPSTEVTSSVKPAQKTVEVKPSVDLSLDSLGLSDEELSAVHQAIGDTDVKEWVRQAILQRANAINALHAQMNEDLSTVPSEVLMTEKKYRTNPIACRELTSRAVRAIKAFNEQSEHKWCITNKLISELTGNTVKAIAKAVEGMDNESYNQNKGGGLKPIANRLTRAAVGEPRDVMSIKDILGID